MGSVCSVLLVRWGWGALRHSAAGETSALAEVTTSDLGATPRDTSTAGNPLSGTAFRCVNCNQNPFGKNDTMLE